MLGGCREVDPADSWTGASGDAAIVVESVAVASTGVAMIVESAAVACTNFIASRRTTQFEKSDNKNTMIQDAKRGWYIHIVYEYYHPRLFEKFDSPAIRYPPLPSLIITEGDVSITDCANPDTPFNPPIKAELTIVEMMPREETRRTQRASARWVNCKR